MGVRVVNNWRKFLTGNAQTMDAALGTMAYDIERIAKTHVPVKKGQLLQSGRARRKGPLHFVVEFNKEYAAYQEAGQRRDGTRIVRNYSKSGTGKHFLAGAGKAVAQNAPEYFKSATIRLKV